MALVFAIPMLRHYLKGRRLTVRTDHGALRLILSIMLSINRKDFWEVSAMMADASQKLTKGRQRLEEV